MIEFGTTVTGKQIKKSIEDLNKEYAIEKVYIKAGVVGAVLNKENNIVYAITKSGLLIQFNPANREIEKTLPLQGLIPTVISISIPENLVAIGTTASKIIGVDVESFSIKYIYEFKKNPIKGIAISTESFYVIDSTNEMTAMGKNGSGLGSTNIPDREFIIMKKNYDFFSGGLQEIRLQESFFYASKIYEARDKVISVFHTHKYLLALLETNICEVFDIETGAIFDDIYVEGDPSYITMTQDEKTLIVGDKQGKVTFYDIEFPEFYIEFQMSSRPITFIYVMTETKQIFAFSGDIRVSIVRIPTFPKYKIFKAFSPYLMYINNTQIAYLERGIICMYDTRTKQSKQLLKLRGLSPVFIFIQPNHLVSTANQSLIFLNIITNKLTQFKYSKNIHTKCLAVDLKSTSLALATNESTLVLFSLEKFEFMFETFNVDGDIKAVTYCSKDQVAFSFKSFLSFLDVRTNEVRTNDELDSGIEELLCNKEYLYVATEEATIYIFNWKLRLQVFLLETTSEMKITKLWIGEENLISASSDLITFWDLKTHSRVFSIDPLIKNDSLDISPDCKSIAYSTGTSMIFMENPYHSKDFRIYGGSENELPNFVKTLNSIYKLNKIEHNPDHNEWIIMPHHTNIGHIYAIMSLPDNLRDFIQTGGAIINNSLGYNVLSYCVTKNLDACTIIIIEELKKRLISNPFTFSFINHDMLQSLNLKGSELLSKLYELIYISSNQSLIEMFCPADLKLPIYYHSDEFEIIQKNFFEPRGQDEGEDDSNVPVQYKQSLVKLSLEVGSERSKAFIRSLLKCPYHDIFTTPLVQDILLEKWEKLRWILFVQGFVYMIHLLVFGFLLFYPKEAPYLSIVLFILNLLLTFYELFQVYVLLFDYLTDLWNWIDFLRLTSMNLFIILYWQNDGNSTDDHLYFYTNSCVTLLVFLRGISYFRLFESTRYMIDLIKEAITDMLGFVLVLAFSVISFAFIFYTLEDSDKHTTLIDNIINSYTINLGGGEIKGGELYKILFYFATFINPIILLNLLISILGSTFGRVESSRVISNFKELASLVLEVEQLYTVKVENKEFFFQSCLMPEEIVIPEPISLKVKKISVRVKAMDVKFDEMSEKIDTIAENTAQIAKMMPKSKSDE
jgi:hypothetical protein